MKTLMLLLLILTSSGATAQINSFRKGSNSLLGFFRVKENILPVDYRATRQVLVLRTPPSDAFTSSSYWQTATYTTYSENGRIRTTHIFDINGQLRESRPSVSLRKTGVLSYLRVQFSLQRQPTLFTYTLH